MEINSWTQVIRCLPFANGQATMNTPRFAVIVVIVAVVLIRSIAGNSSHCEVLVVVSVKIIKLMIINILNALPFLGGTHLTLVVPRPHFVNVLSAAPCPSTFVNKTIKSQSSEKILLALEENISLPNTVFQTECFTSVAYE